jgi:superoxide reductase
MSTKKFGDIIYSPEEATGEAITKVESHTPKIDVPEEIEAGKPVEVKISVGPHPSKVEHSIRWIEVYFYEEGRAFNPILLARTMFAPGYAEPTITFRFTFNKSGVLYALEYCNLHGVWENRKEIKVK